MNCTCCKNETKDKTKNIPLCRSCRGRIPEAKEILITEIKKKEEENMAAGGFHLAPIDATIRASIRRLKTLILEETRNEKE